MAEKGGDQINPFSFKKFVTEKEKKIPHKTEFNGDLDNIFDSSDAKSKRADKKKETSGKGSTEVLDLEGPAYDEPASSGKKDKQKDNPFSFKKFLSSSSTNEKRKGDDKNISSPPDIASNVPVYIRDHFEDDKSNTTKGDPLGELEFSPLNLKGNSLADSSEVSSSSILDVEVGSKILSTKNKSSISQPNSLIGAGEHDGQDAIIGTFAGRRKASSPSAGLQMGLPDFLSDGAVKNDIVSQSADVFNRDRANSRDRNEDLLSQIRIMQDENEKLRQELMREKQKSSEKNQKLSQLKIALERQKKKEVEDTTVLERAVQQVEENLVTTTQRALQAESVASKHKVEIKALQGQVRALTAEVEVYRSGDGGVSDLRERTKYSSEQLQLAATAAEKNLKELMAGVDQIKLMSLVLSSFEKVTELKEETKPS